MSVLNAGTFTTVDSNEETETSSATDIRKIRLHFVLRKSLIYYTNFDDGRERLYVPKALEKEVFELAHDYQHHGGFH